jgi:hypothetical protein
MGFGTDSSMVLTGVNKIASPFRESVRPAIEKSFIADKSYLPDPFDTVKRIEQSVVVYPSQVMLTHSIGYVESNNSLDGSTALSEMRRVVVCAGDASAGVEFEYVEKFLCLT